MEPTANLLYQDLEGADYLIPGRLLSVVEGELSVVACSEGKKLPPENAPVLLPAQKQIDRQLDIHLSAIPSSVYKGGDLFNG